MVKLSKYEKKVLKPLRNFIRNSPLYLDFIISSGTIRIFYRNYVRQDVYSINISEYEKQDTPIHDLIKKIKEEIVIPLYPKVTLKIVEQFPISLEERIQFLENGQSVPPHKEVITIEDYYLDKVSFQQNVIILTDVATREKHRKYKSRLPLIFFNETLAATRFFSGKEGPTEFAKLLEQDFDFVSLKNPEEEKKEQ